MLSKDAVLATVGNNSISPLLYPVNGTPVSAVPVQTVANRRSATLDILFDMMMKVDGGQKLPLLHSTMLPRQLIVRQ